MFKKFFFKKGRKKKHERALKESERVALEKLERRKAMRGLGEREDEESFDDGDEGEHKKDEETEKLFHGVSGTQRGGSAISKLRDIIGEGSLFPAGKDLDDFDRLHMEIIDYADAHGQLEDLEELNIEEYLDKTQYNKELISKPFVKKYLENDSFRETIKRFESDKINSDAIQRKFTNWFNISEEETAESYGDEMYFEFDVPKKDVRKTIEKSGEIASTHKPLSLNNAKKIVFSKKYEKEIPEIREKLDKKGFNHIKLEIRN